MRDSTSKAKSCLGRFIAKGRNVYKNSRKRIFSHKLCHVSPLKSLLLSWNSFNTRKITEEIEIQFDSEKSFDSKKTLSISILKIHSGGNEEGKSNPVRPNFVPNENYGHVQLFSYAISFNEWLIILINSRKTNFPSFSTRHLQT